MGSKPKPSEQSEHAATDISAPSSAADSDASVPSDGGCSEGWRFRDRMRYHVLGDLGGFAHCLPAAKSNSNTLTQCDIIAALRTMRWKYFPLSPDDVKAKAYIIENLSIGAFEHTLTKKLLGRFASARGEMFAIAFESLDLNSEHLYKYATYGGGKWVIDEPIVWTDSPRWGLIAFVDQWLQQSSEAVVVCENFFATRESIRLNPRESRIALYGEQVYHILSNEDAGHVPSIECALRESEHHWAAGICTLCREIPEAEIGSEEFFDEIVAHAAHVFTPAFDNEGYLVWSPEAAGPISAKGVVNGGS